MEGLRFCALPSDSPKWSFPTNFANLLSLHKLPRLASFDLELFKERGPKCFVVNLNNQYRLHGALAKTKGEHNHCVYDALSDDFKSLFYDSNSILLLDMSTECFFPRKNIIEALHLGASESNLDVNRIFVLNNNIYSDFFHPTFPDVEISSLPRVLAFDTCLALTVGHNRTLADLKAMQLRELKRDAVQCAGSDRRKFISLNGRARPHRAFLLLWLYANRYLDDGHVSFLGYGSPELSKMVQRFLLNSSVLDADMCLAALNEFCKMLPLTQDVTLEASQEKAAYKTTLPWSLPPIELYQKAWFSVVIDTTFSEPNTLFLTPIAFKSFANLSPFVYTGNYGALKHMRSLGFETFHPFFDESYDEAVDPTARMVLLQKEISRLLNLSGEELKELYIAMLPILEHNYNHFWRTLMLTMPDKVLSIEKRLLDLF